MKISLAAPGRVTVVRPNFVMARGGMEIDRETNFSAVEDRPQAPPWFSRPDGDQRWAPGDRAPPRQGPQAALRLMPARGKSPIRIERLRRRADFLAAARAGSFATPGVVVQARNRNDGGSVRVGFTVTKKLGTAVVRNRIKRRLREAARLCLPEAAEPGHDYVLVGRAAGLKRPFDGLQNDIATALKRLRPQPISRG
jgi:ribonuclease P protein component